MKLKTATLFAIIGVSLALLFILIPYSSRLFGYDDFVFNFSPLGNIITYSCLLVFFIVLYRNQK